MKRIILVYGAVAGVVIILSMIAGNYLLRDAGFSIWLGYLVMLIALSSIFVGIKRYRDQQLGGVIKFSTAFILGLGIVVVAGVAYVTTWEIHLAITDYAFIEEYTDFIIRDAVSEGTSGDDLAALEREMAEMKAHYGNVLYRVPVTFLEIFPVGLLVALVSAAVLKNPKVLPS